MTTRTLAPADTAPAKDVSAFARLYRKLFSDGPELSTRVRALTLLASLWAASSLVLVGASTTLPLAVMPFFVLGHFVAYRALKKRVPGLPIAIALVIIIVGVSMRHELVLAIRGERIPVAHFLLIAGAASVFEARTRGGLYTQVFFSALIMFFASELAFGNEFAVMLGGYLAIVVALLATVQHTESTRGAVVARRGGLSGPVMFWTGTGVLVAAFSFVAFLLLPWNNSQAPQASRLAILPVTGVGNGQEAAMTPEQARAMLERLAADAAQGADAVDPRSGDNVQRPGVTVRSPVRAPGTLPAGVDRAARIPPGSTPLLASSGPGDETVAYVRSAIASYWRRAVYDTFDPESLDGRGMWYSTMPDRRRLASLFSRPEDAPEDVRYLQTVFVQRDLGSDFLAGYEPVAIAIPRDRYGRPVARAGTTYQVVSGEPPFSQDDLRLDRRGYAASEFSELPAGYEDVYQLSRILTDGAETDFDRAAVIAAYLNALEYDQESESPLTPGADLTKFVFGESPGSAIDFATAQTLMTRAAGLQARVATGYLPGAYNAYSGAAEITEKDAHAWAEVLFEDAGWVPFDSSSRPDLPTPNEGRIAPPTGLSSLIDRRFGDNIASAIRDTPSGLRTAFEWVGRAGPVLLALGALIAAGGAFVYWWLYFRQRGMRDGSAREKLLAYTLPDGAGRHRVLAAFRRLEKKLARAGFRKRRANESFGAYADRAGRCMSAARSDLRVVAGLASRAAFSAQPVDVEDAATMKRLIDRADLRISAG